jgi:hypothetical protein
MRHLAKSAFVKVRALSCRTAASIGLKGIDDVAHSLLKNHFSTESGLFKLTKPWGTRGNRQLSTVSVQ